MVVKFIQALLNSARRPAKVSAHRPWLFLEILEQRQLLATLFWTGNAKADTNFSNAVNWSVIEDGQLKEAQAAPTATDDVNFRADGKDGKAWDATVDAAFQGSVHNLTFDLLYDKTVTLARSLTVLGTATIPGANNAKAPAVIAGQGDLYIGDNPAVGPPTPATLNWSGGTISGSTSAKVIVNSNSKVNMTSGTKVIDGRDFVCQGGGNWDGNGNLYLKNTGRFFVDTTATFSITSMDLVVDGNGEAGTLF